MTQRERERERERESERGGTQAGGVGEGDAGFPLSREPECWTSMPGPWDHDWS